VVVVSQVLPTIFHSGENPGIHANSTSSKPLESAAGASDGGSGHRPAAFGEIVVPEGNPVKGVPADDSIEPSGNAAMREAAGGTVPAREYRPAGAGAGRERETREEEHPGSAVVLPGESERSAGVVTDTAEGMHEKKTGDGELGPTGVEMTATAERGREGSDSPQPARLESRSSCEAFETSGGRPGTAGDNDSGTKSREVRQELTRNCSERNLSRKKSKRSVPAGSRARSPGKVRTSAGGTSAIPEDPANTPHLQV